MSDYIASCLPTPTEPTLVEIRRTGLRPLRGVVTHIGEGAVCGTGTTTRVHIYRRQAGGWVVCTEHLGARDNCAATLCQSAGQVLTAMTGDDGRMRRAEQEAWEAACERDQDLAAIRTEAM